MKVPRPHPAELARRLKVFSDKAHELSSLVHHHTRLGDSVQIPRVHNLAAQHHGYAAEEHDRAAMIASYWDNGIFRDEMSGEGELHVAHAKLRTDMATLIESGETLSDGGAWHRGLQTLHEAAK